MLTRLLSVIPTVDQLFGVDNPRPWPPVPVFPAQS